MFQIYWPYLGKWLVHRSREWSDHYNMAMCEPNKYEGVIFKRKIIK